MTNCPETLRACADLSEKARFLNAFVRTQKSRQQVKLGKTAWLDDERALREQERKADETSQKQFECMASSWLPPAVTAEYRQQLQQSHVDQNQLRMDKRGTVGHTKAGALDPGKAAFLAKQELQLADNLGKEADSLEKAIKQLHRSATCEDDNVPWWCKFGGGEASCDTAQTVGNTVSDSDEDMLQQAEHFASINTAMACETAAANAGDELGNPQWHREAVAEAMELCQKRRLAKPDVHACVHQALKALHFNFYQAAQSVLEGVAQKRQDLPAAWTQEDDLAFHAAMEQVVNSAKPAATRGEILEAVQHRMPGKSLCEIRRMDRKVWHDYSCKIKRRELTQMWIRQHTAVLDECAQLLSESEAEAFQHAFLSAEVVETEVAKQRAQLQHQYHCQVHEKIINEKEVIEAAELAKQAAAASARQDFNIQKHEASKIKVQVHRQRLASNAAAEQQAALERLKVAELQRQPQRLQNAVRVRFRDGITCKKKEDMKKQLQRQKDEGYARESRLNRIRAMVKVDVVPDKDRPLKPTKCMLAEAYRQHSVFADAHGYTADEVTSDKRHRAMTLMRSKGLLGKPYAQDALRQMYNNAKPSRIDCLTSDQILGSYVAPRLV